MTPRRFLLALTGLFLLGLALSPAFAQTHVSDQSAAFIRSASLANMYAIQAADLADTRSTRADVRRVSDVLIADHRKNAEALKSLIAAHALDITPPLALDQPHQDRVITLKATSADAFDPRYISMQRAAHMQTIVWYEDYVKRGDIPALRKFAVTALPALREHLALLQSIPLSAAAKP